MRTFTLLFMALFASFSMNAQVVIINSPASLQGPYQWGEGFGSADLTSNVWTGDCILIADTSTTNPTQGCFETANDIAGKIALIDRGSCEFGVKALNAEMAGALAVVILNNVSGGVIPLGAGAVGDQVTIPVVMLSLENGNSIKAALDNNEVVNMTIGNLQLPNDISTQVHEVSPVLQATYPANQITEADVSVFSPLARIINNGLNDAPNVTTTVDIDFTPPGGSATQVYSESVSESLLSSGDSVLIALPDHDFVGSSVGDYQITYSIESDSLDGLQTDNSVSSNFSVTENAFSEGPWDFENNRPAFTLATTILDGGPIEMLSSFYVPKGVGYSIDSVQFYVEVDTSEQPTLAGNTISLLIYEWKDMNEDSSYQNDEITVVGANSITFDASAPEGTWVTLPVLDNIELTSGYVIPEDGGHYMVGTRYEGPLTVSFGFNRDYSFALLFDLNLFKSEIDWPYLQITEFLGQAADIENDAGRFTDFWATTSTAMYVNLIPTVSTNEILTDAEAKLHLFPNPVSAILNTEVTLKEQTKHLTYRITDINGKLIFSTKKEDVTRDISTFNIDQLPTGQYNFSIQTDKGIKTERFTVQR